MTKFEIQTEARERQGKVASLGGKNYRFLGTPRKVEFRQGAEGLVQPVVDANSGSRYRFKCFFDPSPERLKRSTVLVEQRLANVQKNFADALGGAPFEVLENVGRCTPFAVVMKEIQGDSWDRIKDAAKLEAKYPPTALPPLTVRATWAYGLATAVKQMEQHGFIHTDIAHGNVMVSANGPLAGSMALVDFDAFVHPRYPHLDTECLGTAGYAAPEVNRSDSQRLRIGTDRVGMAILIQEFLLYGDADMSDPDSFLKGYDQDEDLNRHQPIAHPCFESKYPQMANLLKRTLAAKGPEDRPGPEEWRSELYALAGGKAVRKPLVDIRLHGYPVVRPDFEMEFANQQLTLDLLGTAFALNIRLERETSGSVDAVIPTGTKIRYRAGSATWTEANGPLRIPVTPGLLLTGLGAKSGVRFEASEQKPLAKGASA